MTTVASFCVALLFASVFLFGGRFAYSPEHRRYRRFLSIAAGIAVGYTFVHLLPALGRMRDITMQSPGDFQRIFPEYSVYLWSLAGFLVFFCLETMVGVPEGGAAKPTATHGSAAPWKAWLHIGGFSMYAWMLSYIMVWKAHHILALSIYGLVMGLHLFPIACNLRSHYQKVYDRRGAFLLALAALAGWGTGLVVVIPLPILVNLVAVIAGGVIVNAAIAELPKQGEGRRWPFITGALVCAALLLILSHFENGG